MHSTVFKMLHCETGKTRRYQYFSQKNDQKTLLLYPKNYIFQLWGKKYPAKIKLLMLSKQLQASTM